MDNRQKHPILDLDDRDKMLTKELEMDARQSIRVLSRKLGESEATTKKRLSRLLDNEAICIIAFTDRLSLGLQVLVVMGINAKPGEADEVMKQLFPHERIRSIILTTGRYDILAYAEFQNLIEFSSFFDEELGRVKNITGVETMMSLEIHKASSHYLSDHIKPMRQSNPRDLDDVDTRLIKELELHPRESISKLAKKIGVNPKLASRKMQSLMADNIVRVIGFPTPAFFGLSLPICIFLKLRPGQVGLIANKLTADKRIHYISSLTGRFQLLISAAFHDLDELSHFLRNRLGKLPGVVSHETLIQVSLVKGPQSLLS